MSDILEAKTEGWVVINIGHPNTGRKFIVDSTFKRLRQDAINEFVSTTGTEWKYWKKNFNFRVVRASMNVKVLINES